MQNVVGPTLVAKATKFGQIWAIFHKIAYKSACMPDRPDMFGPTRGPTLVAMATTFALGAESSRLPACNYYYFLHFLA